jgi:hypothetical protein
MAIDQGTSYETKFFHLPHHFLVHLSVRLRDFLNGVAVAICLGD